ncbi:hypothetical protein NHJ13734_000273 [Beauveria thailandica]
MAAPADKTVLDLNGNWIMNAKLSDSSDAVLKAQGVNWLMRKVITMATVTLIVTQTRDASGNVLLDIENKPSGGMPGAVEKRVLNWEPVELNHTLFGNIRGRSRVVRVGELDDEWLRGGWEEGTDEVLHFKTEHMDSKGVVTQQVLGFVRVDGVRYQARRVLVTTEGVDKNVEITIIYDYLGTGEVSQ